MTNEKEDLTAEIFFQLKYCEKFIPIYLKSYEIDIIPWRTVNFETNSRKHEAQNDFRDEWFKFLRKCKTQFVY